MEIFLFEVNDDNALSISIKEDACEEVVYIPACGPDYRPVRRINKYGFQGNQHIRKVIIPEGVHTIDNGAFGKCINLQEVVLPESLKVIKANAFRECPCLEKIDLPSYLKQIGVNAFNGCDALETIHIPSSVNYIADAGFRNCFNLTIFCTSRAQSQKWGPAWATNVHNVIFADSVEVRFGEQPIPNKIKMVYQQAISKFFGDVTLLTSDEISTLKGMCNRCIKHDQSDWRTTYSMIGTPERAVLKKYVDEIVAIRDDIRAGNYDNVISFRDKYYDIFNNAYKELCGNLPEGKTTLSDSQVEHGEIRNNLNEQDGLTDAAQNTSVYEQIERIEDFVHSYPPDKDNGRYSSKACKHMIHIMLNNGIIHNLAFGQRGREYIVWIPGIDIIGASEKDAQKAIDKLGRRLVVEIGRCGLKAFVNTSGQYSSVLFGEDATKLSPEGKYNAIMDVILEATSQGRHFVVGRCVSALRRLYDLKLIESPVEHYSRNHSYVAKIPGIDVEGTTNASGSEIHRQNAADKDLVHEILIHHNQGTLKRLIKSTLLFSNSFETINEDWLLSCDDEPEEPNRKMDIYNTPNEKIAIIKPKPTINTTVKLTQLDFSFEEKDDDDDLNF